MVKIIEPKDFAADVGGHKVTLKHSFLEQESGDAVMLAQYSDTAPLYGAMAAICRATKSLEPWKAFKAALEQKKSFRYGTSVITETGLEDPKFLINVIVTGAGGRDTELSNISKAVSHGLNEAGKHGIKTIKIPPIGCGVHNHCTPEESARAVLNGIYTSPLFANQQTAKDHFDITLCLKDPDVFIAFKKVLSEKTYLLFTHSDRATGTRADGLIVSKMGRDEELNRKIFGWDPNNDKEPATPATTITTKGPRTHTNMGDGSPDKGESARGRQTGAPTRTGGSRGDAFRG